MDTENNPPQIDQTTLGEKDDMTPARHGVAVNLGLDVDALKGVLLEPGDVDLNVEVANV